MRKGLSGRDTVLIIGAILSAIAGFLIIIFFSFVLFLSFYKIKPASVAEHIVILAFIGLGLFLISIPFIVAKKRGY